MERFKQTITKLENDVAELKQFQTKIQGSTQSKGDIHYCTGTQEFGEYELDEIDTFRFSVVISPGQNNITMYRYRLLNPPPGFSRLGGIEQFSPIPVSPENFEDYCMKKNGTPFVLTDEIRKCLDSKLWEFAVDSSISFIPCGYQYSEHNEKTYRDIRRKFYIDITIPFTHTYTISPHISFYITPLSNALDDCEIHEITTKQVVFRIKYGNANKQDTSGGDNRRNIYSSELKLHYSISGVVEQNNNLLD